LQAQRAVELAATDAAGLVGYVMLQAGRPAEAQTQFTTAAQAQPNDARWQLGLGLVALGQRDAGPALDLLERAAQIAPDEPLPRAYLAAAHLRAGDLHAADAAASQAVRLGPDHHLSNTYLAYVRLAQGRLDEAVAAGATAVQAAPRSALAHEALGTAQFFAGDLTEARASLDEAVGLNPLSGSTHLTLAKLLAAEDEIEDALGEAQLAVSLNPESGPSRSTLGMLLLLNNDPRRAGREFGKALEADPSLVDAQTGWGTVLARRGQFREALNQQKSAVAVDTGSAAAHNNLGGAHAALGHMDPALDELQLAIDLQPEWGLPHGNLALVHLEQNRFREAIEAGERAVELGERSAHLHTILARAYMRQGRTDRALAELRQAVSLDEDYAQARFQLAQLYLQQDRARDAVREILTAVTTDPSAMLETRRYARTENTFAAGEFGRLHFDGRHSNVAAKGRVNFFLSGQLEDTGGFRSVNQDHAEQFLEIIAGDQPRPTQQLVLFATLLNRTGGLPGPVTPGSGGDADNRQSFTGVQASLAYRQRLSRDVTATGKYSFRRDMFRFRDPSSLTGSDTNPFQMLVNAEAIHSPELRVDANLNDKLSVRAGLGALWNDRDRHGTAGTFDPGTGTVTFSPFSTSDSTTTTTAWVEGQARLSDEFSLLLGEYWGDDEGAPAVGLPKVVATYHPDRSTWLSLIANPIFRADIAELAPVEALADPAGLSPLNFVEGGAGRSYELRYQRIGRRSSTLTTSLSYQRVRGLLIDVQDPQLTGLPTREVVKRGHRWIADAAYEQWLTDTITGRVFVRWQDSRGRFPQAQVFGTEWPYTPEWQVGGRLDYIDPSGLRIGLDVVHVGQRFHDAQNTQVVGDYPLVNLHVQFQRNLHQNYILEINNLTDRNYQTFAGFPQAGLSVFGGVEYRY
jgi:tetratricopeptide (TPR) repeat protein